jgi:hypothetical protein
MPLLPACREAHSRMIAGVCPWCRRTISNGHIVWQLSTGTVDLNEEPPRSNAESSFPLSVRDDQQELPRLRAMLNDPAEEAQDHATSHLMIFGNKLDLWEAEQLEEHVGQGPEDLWLRIVLIGCYQLKCQSETARSKLRGHILWIVENVPESSIAGKLGSFCFGELKDRGEFYDQVKRLLLGVVTANPQNALLLGRAAEFFTLLDEVWSGELLRKAKAIEPENPKWSQRLAFLYNLEMAGRQDESRQDWAAMALAQWQNAESLLTGEQGQTELLDHLATAAFEAGELEMAEGYARELLARASPVRHPGDVIHIGNLVLGRIALSKGDIEKAKSHLIESARTDGSPVLCSFGPRMTLAKELLVRGETEVVLRYLKLCSVFWKRGRDDLARWAERVEKGEEPDFPKWHC